MTFRLLISFFVQGATIIGCIANMKLYLSDIEESYKDTIIGHLVYSGTEDLLLHMVRCWFVCAVDEEILYLPMVMYCSRMM